MQRFVSIIDETYRSIPGQFHQGQLLAFIDRSKYNVIIA